MLMLRMRTPEEVLLPMEQAHQSVESNQGMSSALSSFATPVYGCLCISPYSFADSKSMTKKFPQAWCGHGGLGQTWGGKWERAS